MNASSFSIDEIPIAYIDEGSGPPVILAHCSSASHRMWRGLIDRLKSRHRVIAPDFTGYGASGRWPPERAFDPGIDARILMKLARMANEPAHFVGHSYGGAMTLEAVRHLRSHARAMTLIEPVAFPLLPVAGRLREWEIVKKVAEAVNEAVSRGDRRHAASAYMGFWLGRLQWWMLPRKFKGNVLETIDKVALEFQAAKDIVPPSLNVYKSLNVPTLLVYGSRTRKPAKAVVDVLHGVLPASQLKVIPGAGHMSPITHRKAVNAIIRAHIEACAAQGRSGEGLDHVRFRQQRS